MFEWLLVAHIVSVISWMAAMLYLPRLLVYHYDFAVQSEASETFKIMERRLLKGIMTPAMIFTWVFGLSLMYLSEAWLFGWFISKFFLVFLLSGFHGVCSKWVREFSEDQRNKSVKFYRIMNEVPAVFLVLIVILVVVKPF
ncbi:MAG: TIGR00701 family protein [Hyphomicrobiales bacterium]|nr:protoporphyrinogen oxidase HemJ [Hyphomicrobiales bacterium]PCH51401.1 MAG: TIGR00701 family protein [Hyphomicrobiales bacterium]